MTQPREPNGLVAFHISREKIEERKSIFLIPAAPQPSHRGGELLHSLGALLSSSQSPAKFIGSKKN